MTRKISSFTFDEFTNEFRARRNDNDDALHTCTHEMHDRDVATLRRDAFNNDKSQRSGKCVWCRYCERVWNAHMRDALIACDAHARANDCDVRITLRRHINDVDNVTLRDELHDMYDAHMRDMRSRRYARRNNDVV